MVIIVVFDVLSFIFIYLLLRLKQKDWIKALFLTLSVFIVVGFLTGTLLEFRGDRFIDGLISWPFVLALMLINKFSPLSGY
ncbi:hypothetical protein A3D81_01885 [Candidatus Curtissbacteria bacterium RIFCSPHIGHO2_02_FULL_40_17]|uniref:Uncharacterized protein n=2 Tax=Candidatus Curtissiibacteriota TaxID=1752717 RepID=A0A1F5GG49_9BACT|nr:MAG: hypothetical protein A2693_02305 [Candidatus Curtissbacteria bacterium RIFCSPHIGHO2_01_FULL_40_12]OGD90868.1 MAG: hypothetical protein A3D81_01885 [Candidatus Curtissbacteria bacterium RIFCSPHIGHO2_02_FULL_40_17]